MTQPASISPSTDTGVGAKRSAPSSAKTWFRTRAGHRYGWELGLVIVGKLALLVVLWFVFIEPWPRPTTPATFVQQIYQPVAPVSPP